MTLIRFALVGILNTALGLAVLLIALHMGAGDYGANALGYAAGLTLSYLLNRNWTFAVPNSASPAEFARFLGAFILAYIANLLLLFAGRAAGFAENPLLHLAAITLYSVLFFYLSRTLAFGDTSAGPSAGSLSAMLARHTPELALGFVALVTWIALRGISFTHDVVWQFWIARKILDGAVLYRDIWEINPPLWFWSAIPVQYVADLTGISPFRLLLSFIIGAAALSSILLGHLYRTRKPLHRFLIMALAFGLCTIVPLYDFGQREQLALICTLPYAALIARRLSGSIVSGPVVLTVAVIAAFGFALKHYFVLVPLSLELWLLARGGRDWRPIRLETLTLAACALAYAVSVPLFAPDFFGNIVPMVNTAYHGYDASWHMLLIRPWVKVWTCIAIFLLILRADIAKRGDPLIVALLIAAMAFTLAYLIQHKGWLYHSIPVTGTLGMAAGLAVGLVARRWIPGGLAIMALPFVLPALSGSYHNLFRPEIDPVLATIPKGEAVYIVSSDPMWAWPNLEDHGLVWPSRLYAFWMIPAIAHAEILGPNPEPLRQLSVRIQKEAALEIRCSRPALIAFERQPNYIYQPASFDVRGFFLRRPEIRDFLDRNYRMLEATPSLYLYRRVADPVFAHEPSCPMVSRSKR